MLLCTHAHISFHLGGKSGNYGKFHNKLLFQTMSLKQHEAYQLVPFSSEKQHLVT